MSQKDPVNILLVDDQPAKLLTYEVILSELGENLIQAGSAREALEYLLKNDIAIILIDVVMPDLDGFELAAMIRAHPRCQKIAVMFVSAQALSDIDRIKACAHSAVDYVPIPVVPELLRAKVRVFAEFYRKARQLEVFNAELERRVEERTAELAHANAVLRQRVEEYRLEREDGMVQVQHEMQDLQSLGQLALNLTDGTFAPASRLLLDPTRDPNELVQLPESEPCGFEYSRSSPEQCIGESTGDSESTGASEVTTRELEVLAALAKGKSNKMIGRELNMREGTVKVHVRSLLKKLNATNRTQLALRAYRALDTAQAVSGGGLTIPAEPAAGPRQHQVDVRWRGSWGSGRLSILRGSAWRKLVPCNGESGGSGNFDGLCFIELFIDLEPMPYRHYKPASVEWEHHETFMPRNSGGMTLWKNDRPFFPLARCIKGHRTGC
jgi:DNA-binding NarL/FixJ family response regulator